VPRGPSAAAPRLAVRCDGDERTGAGHVARCLPLALALRAQGWHPVFVGRYAGLAEWLCRQAGVEVRPATAGQPCGLDPAAWAAALVDLYDVPEAELCELADEIDVATPAEASRCGASGTWIDYHLDRAGAAPSPRELAGPAYAPLAPELPALRRDPGRDVRVALVVTGGSTAARRMAGAAIAALQSAFPGVRVLAGSGIAGAEGVEALPFPGGLLDAIAAADVAVSAAGLTAYELACAGVPAVLVGMAENQRRVLEGSRRAGTALVADERSLAAAVTELADGAVRARIATRGIAHFDGAGPARAAAMLDRLWRDGADPAGLVLRRAVPGDRDRLLAWRNDAATRAGSFSPGVVTAPDHERWLARTLADAGRRLFVAEEGGAPVGQVRLDRDGTEAEVSISVAPSARGRGVAGAMLAAADGEGARWGITALVARIKPSNERSLRLFRSAGYAGETATEDGQVMLVRTLGGPPPPPG
jgi:RimJ/RimL family protein N-acetyltransferase